MAYDSPPTQNTAPRKSKGFFWLAMLLVALLAIGSGYLIWDSRPKPAPPAPTIATPIKAPASIPTVKPTPTEVPDIDSIPDPDPTEAPTTNGTEEDGVVIEGDTVTYPDGRKENTKEYQPKKKRKVSKDSMRPNRLLISCTGAYGKLQKNSIRKGFLSLNHNPYIITQWDKGSTVGAKEGNIVLSGHVSYNGTHGTLYNLAKIKPGCVAYITDADGKQEAFKLVTLNKYDKGRLPMKDIWQVKGAHKLVIITCAGSIMHTRHGNVYSDNIVATFVPVPIV